VKDVVLQQKRLPEWRANPALQPDRFAREIVGILALSCAARSRRLNAKPFGGLSPIVRLTIFSHDATIDVLPL
jgi:hypothetical protein